MLGLGHTEENGRGKNRSRLDPSPGTAGIGEALRLSALRPGTVCSKVEGELSSGRHKEVQ